MNSAYGVVAIVLICTVTLGIGAFGLRLSRTTSDFYVAGRTVTPYRNASAIGGEYLSAASFLGIAGLVYTNGLDMLWFPVGYTVGYVVLLVLVAAPLRRSGAYTLPDFAEARLESSVIRRLCSVLVVGDRLALPAAAAPGRRTGAAHRHRGTHLGRRAHRRGRRGGQRRGRRDALDHARAGRPVLDQAHRDRGPGLRPARRLGGRRRAESCHRPASPRGPSR